MYVNVTHCESVTRGIAIGIGFLVLAAFVIATVMWTFLFMVRMATLGTAITPSPRKTVKVVRITQIMKNQQKSLSHKHTHTPSQKSLPFQPGPASRPWEQ